MKRWAGRALCTLTALAAALLLLAHWAEPRRGNATLYALSGRTATSPAPVPTVAFDVNTDSVETLRQLPGVGPAIAEAIREERLAHGAYFYAEDLLAVKGIGPKTLEKMRSLLMGE